MWCSWACLFVIAPIAFAQTPAVCRALVPGLTSPSADTRERSARGIYQKCPSGITAMLPSLNSSLRKSIEMGNVGAAAYLLLGRFHDPETRAFLEQRLKAKSKVKLESWQPPVSAGIAAAAGAVSGGSEGARARLKEGLKPIEEAEFLASVIQAIEDQVSLQALLKLLDDERTVNSGVPSGAEPKTRVADLALESYVKRFALKAVPLRPGARYSPAEIAQVRKLIAEEQ